MDNHVHLLIRNPDATISDFMRKIGICYAGYFNQKYKRVGHLFQNRFKSEVITDTSYLLSAFRYILRNPENAGIAPANHYRWNSYDDYNRHDRLTDTSLLVELIGSKSEYIQFMSQKDDIEIMEETEPKRDDDWALNIIKNTLNVPSGTVIQQMNKNDRDEALAKLRSKGISIRQLERLTGISRGVIFKAGKSSR